jgi:MGT family glycosyltransferase
MRGRLVTSPSVAVFAMAERGHFARLKPLIAGLVERGVDTHVFTDALFREDVQRLGGRFVDLFAEHPLASIDGTSIPVPSRFVSFAGHCGERISTVAAALRPSLVIHDSFAVIGRVVATRLGLPRVNVCAGHNAAPDRMLADLRVDPRVRISDECHRGVELLRERFGIEDASPFSYVSSTSPDLNLYCEPPQFLPPESRGPFEPLRFFGSLAPGDHLPGDTIAWAFETGPSRARSRIYVSFGTIVWRYYAPEALAAIRAISEAFARHDDTSVLVSLGGVGDRSRADACAAPNVRIEYFVDQWRVLQDASVYITHQGLNSTHEAVYHRVPMVSYPFFWDQPGLASRCQALGLAVPLADGIRSPVTPEMAAEAVARIDAGRATMQQRLAEARLWELQTIADRPAIIETIVRLARGA